MQMKAWHLVAGFTVIMMVMGIKAAHAGQDGMRMVCPQPIRSYNADYSRCHFVKRGVRWSLNLNTGMPDDMMAEVCDQNGRDCYTGYVDPTQFDPNK
jgi:hypothetical protein